MDPTTATSPRHPASQRCEPRRTRRLTRWSLAAALGACFAAGCGGTERTSAPLTALDAGTTDSCTVTGPQSGSVEVAATATRDEPFSPAGWTIRLSGRTGQGTLDAHFNLGASAGPGVYQDGDGSSYVTFAPAAGDLTWFAGELGPVGGARRAGAFSLRVDSVSPPHGSLLANLVPWSSSPPGGPWVYGASTDPERREVITVDCRF